MSHPQVSLLHTKAAGALTAKQMHMERMKTAVTSHKAGNTSDDKKKA